MMGKVSQIRERMVRIGSLALEGAPEGGTPLVVRLDEEGDQHVAGARGS